MTESRRVARHLDGMVILVRFTWTLHSGAGYHQLGAEVEPEKFADCSKVGAGVLKR